MNGFGASGTIEQLYPHFGITAEAAARLRRRACTSSECSRSRREAASCLPMVQSV